MWIFIIFVGASLSNTVSYCLLKKNSNSLQQKSQVHFSHSSRIFCSAAVQIMEEETKQSKFDRDNAASLVKALRGQFSSGRTKSYAWRAAQIEGLSRMVDEREQEIIRALQEDLSKPEFEAFISEISTIRSSCKSALSDLRDWMKPKKVKTSVTTYPSSAEIVSEPLGLVLIISTWNYPFLLSLEPVIGAIAAGNAVVLKPSEIAPAASSLLSNLLAEYVDSSLIKVVEGAVDETTALLDQKWDKIFYTGSERVGRIVMAAAVKHLTPIILELGGKCPVVVDSNVNLQVAARRIIAGKWACNNGQTCVGADYVITTKEFAPKLIDALRLQLEEFYGKDPMESKDMSRVVNLYHFKRLTNLLEEDGVFDSVVLGGQADVKQLKIAPTILLNVPDDCLLMREEIFGPLLPIVTVENMEDSFNLIKSKPKPLAAYLFTNDEKLKTKFVDEISAGGMLINDTILHITVPGLPFGGVGESGMGNYRGKFSFDAFSHEKAVLYRSFEGDSSVRYPPYAPQKLKLLKALMSGNIIRIILTSIGWSTD